MLSRPPPTTRVKRQVVPSAIARFVSPSTFEVEHAAGLLRHQLGTVERADQRERGQVDALGHQPGAADGSEQPFDHVALGRDENDALARPGGRVDDTERVKVEYRVVQRHRHLVLGLELTAAASSLWSVTGWQLEGPQHRALVGDADADALAEPARPNSSRSVVAESLLVEHFAVAHRVGASGDRGRALGDDRPVDVACTAATKPGWMSRPTTSAPRPETEVELRG